MHPILGSKVRFGLYLLGWIPLGAGIALLLLRSGQFTLLSAGMSAALLALFYSMVCLSPWYMCQLLPLRPAEIWKVLLNHGAAALVVSALFVGLARLLGAPAPQLGILFGSGVLLYLLAVSMHYVALSFQTSREAESREQEARVLAREAELKALKAQVNPHFLFNSLNSISALATRDGQRAREMCIRLSEFLRSTLNLSEREAIPLAQELGLAKTYLEVEQVRFGDRLRFQHLTGGHCDGCLVPALILQPLVENAVKHGVAGMVEGGEIRIEASHAEGLLHIRVENDFDPEGHPAIKNGIGIENVKRRLQARYHGEARFSAQAAGNRFRVDLEIPCES